MKVNSEFMIKVENEGVEVNTTSIIVTQSDNEHSVYFNYVMEENYRIYLVDLKSGIKYATYSDIESLKKNVLKGYIRNQEDKLEIVLDVLNINSLVEKLELDYLIKK